MLTAALLDIEKCIRYWKNDLKLFFFFFWLELTSDRPAGLREPQPAGWSERRPTNLTDERLAGLG